MTDKAPWTVTQADREAACRFRGVNAHGELRWSPENIRDTDLDVRCLARHRHESQAELVGALREARRELGNAQELLRGTQILVVANVGFEPVLTKIDALLAKIGGAA